ncbi:MAG TPA: cbb3-type cytochrome c oxidase subunit II [Thermoanaerobaculia bacterium]|nr:cbb3-type cytochrome c oxidase subunit II [Thermoanaerobaculia bacterium]
MRYARTVALVAGLLFISLAVFIQGVLPALLPESQRKTVTSVVRTDLGELKWVVANATDYSPLEAEGRRIYIREGCWYCHSQYVRPVTGETRRWGPVSQAGEYAFDQPHLFSTRRIGPDLTRVGLKYGDDWHVAHHWNPRMLVPDSIMPRFPWLFDGPYGPVAIVQDAQGRSTLAQNATTRKLFDFSSREVLALTPDPGGLVYVRQRGKYPVILTPNNEYQGKTVTVLAGTRELTALVAYVQKLGMNRGKWRDLFEPQLLPASNIEIPRSEEFIAYGREVYLRRCVGCHGPKGDGDGPAAAFFEVRPRNFTTGTFKFRSTPSGSLPMDGDLLRTVTDGVRGTPMPTWHELPEKDRLAVIQYVKYELTVDRSDPKKPTAFFVQEEPQPPIYIGAPPPPTPELLAKGKQLFVDVKCAQCHGDQGKGDGPSAGELKDDWGFPIRPADLTTGRFKSGPSVKDIYRTMSTGLNGTPMPSFASMLPNDQDRWAVAYYILALSAYKDPLTGRPLPLPPAARQALDRPDVRADTSDTAFLLQAGAWPRNVWAESHGIALLPVLERPRKAYALKGPGQP